MNGYPMWINGKRIDAPKDEPLGRMIHRSGDRIRKALAEAERRIIDQQEATKDGK
jgi:hypothetical protein